MIMMYELFSQLPKLQFLQVPEEIIEDPTTFPENIIRDFDNRKGAFIINYYDGFHYVNKNVCHFQCSQLDPLMADYYQRNKKGSWNFWEFVVIALILLGISIFLSGYFPRII